MGQPAESKIDSTKNNLDEIIITATKTERILSSLPLNVSIIKKSDIEKTNATRLSDIINEELGLITVSDFGGSEGIQMQGLDSEYTLVLIDNQPLIGRSAGTLDLNRISVGNIKQIEIVRGPSSSLYGNNAFAGVINIITEKPKTGIKGNLITSYETHNTIDNNILFSYKKNNFYSSVFFNNYSSDGYDLIEGDGLNTVNKFKTNTLQVKLGQDIGESLKIKINARYYTQLIDNIAPNSLSGETFTSEDNINFTISHNSEKIRTDFEVYFTSYFGDEFLDDEQGNRFSESFYDQIFLKPEIKTVYKINNKKEFVFGLGNEYETLNRTYFEIEPKQNSPFIYFQYDYNPNEKINLILGGRFDKYKEYKSQVSPKFSGIYKIQNNESIKISTGYGYKTPDFRQLYFNFSNSTVGYTVIGYNVVEDVLNQLIDEGQIANIIVPIEEFENPLSPESSFGVNIGYDRKIDEKISLSTNLFSNSAKNLIDYRVIANKTNGQNVFSYYNVNNVSTFGFDVNTKYKADNYFSFSIGYQLLYAYDLDARKAFENGEVYARLTPTSPAFRLNKKDYFGLYNRSRHMGVIKIKYNNIDKNFSANLRFKYRSKYGLYDSNSNNYLDKYDKFVNGHLTGNVNINKIINSKLTLSAGIENIFNYLDSENISNLSGRIYFCRVGYNIN
jgi:outer membrane receptor for ferrienterochelin and colicins